MPIEDIDFLGENSELDSTLFFLDSDSRDRTVFPSPAEYVIQFTEPIKLVVGLDILDATIPAAMYVIDSHSDLLSVTTLKAATDMGAGVEAQALMSVLLSTCAPVSAAMSSGSVSTVYGKLIDCQQTAQLIDAAMGRPTSLCDASTPMQYLVTLLRTGVTYAFHSVAAMESSLSSLSGTVTAWLTYRKAVFTLQHGNYNVSSLMAQISGTLQSMSSSLVTPMDKLTFSAFNVVSPTSSPVELQGRYAFVNSYPFYMDMSQTAAPVLGFDTLPVISDGGYRCMSAANAFASVLSSTVPVSVLSSTSFATTPVHVVVSPGIANLLGVRYITLRCPEIEQHLYSGMTYGSHSTGLGVFKLPSGNEISNLRFDFVSLVRRPFHPIGRLSRLTLRFEVSDGVLYDFKGINTQLLIAVKFLSPGKRVLLTQSVLNPDYDPDFLRYTLRRTAAEMQLPSHGLLPSPGTDFEDGEGVEHGDEQGGIGEGAGRRRREIAQRLLREQDKYDYPAAEEDTASRRSVN